MTSILAPLLNLVPWHLSVFGALFGTQIYQSFFMTKICYRALPMAQFMTLQSRVFPVYFALQSAGVALAIATYPRSFLRLINFTNKTDTISFGVMLGTSLLNLIIYGPRTEQAMFDRVKQGRIDGQAKTADGGLSHEMKVIRRRFSKNHAMSIHLNVITMAASVAYLFSLGAKIKILDD